MPTNITENITGTRANNGIYDFLEDQASFAGDPSSEAGNAGEGSRNFDFAAIAGTEANNADLVVDAVIDVAQRAARVALSHRKYHKCRRPREIQTKYFLTLQELLPPTVDTQILLSRTVRTL